MKEKDPAVKTPIMNVIVIDRSSSMKKIRCSIIENFNELIRCINKMEEEYGTMYTFYVTLVFYWDKKVKILYDNINIKETKPLTLERYNPRGTKPLYDAIGHSIRQTAIDAESLADPIVRLSIISGGADESSMVYAPNHLSKLLDSIRGKGWFLGFLGLNKLESNSVASEIGLNHFQNYSFDDQGIKEAFCSIKDDLSIFCRLYYHLKMELETDIDENIF